ncbi:MAG: hypothetical protein QN131_05420 [Armatimonadota bacterium]|nr:hypothetical protein [Armatimonadota bacterium]MDR7549367.1 hypothetical protein [Armatimonadota bacterium]
MVTWRGIVAVIVTILFVTPVFASADRVLVPAIVYVPEEYHSGGAYTAIQAGPDGIVYVGTTIYNGYGHLLAYWPRTGRFESLAEMSAATGERMPGPASQAKVHTKPVIAPDGRVYFGTKSGGRSKDPSWQRYPGGHLLVYDPRTRTTTDLGIPRPGTPGMSIIAVGLDRVRGNVYVLSDPDSHLIVYDPRTRTFADHGRLGPEGEHPTRYLVVLANGDVFHQFGPNAMARYNAAAGRIERLPLVIVGTGTYEPPYALAVAPDGRRFFGVGKENGQVYLYEPREREVGLRMLGAAVPEGYTTPGVHYTMTAAPDGAVYYTGFLPGGGGRDLFILRVWPDQGRPQVVGRVATLPPPPAGYSRATTRELIIQGSTATPDGSLVVMQAYPLRLLIFRGLAARQ